MALVKDDDSVKILAQPMDQLLEPRAVFAPSRTFTDERGISGENHAFLDFSVYSRGDLGVFEL